MGRTQQRRGRPRSTKGEVAAGGAGRGGTDSGASFPAFNAAYHPSAATFPAGSFAASTASAGAAHPGLPDHDLGQFPDPAGGSLSSPESIHHRKAPTRASAIHLEAPCRPHRTPGTAAERHANGPAGPFECRCCASTPCPWCGGVGRGSGAPVQGANPARVPIKCRT